MKQSFGYFNLLYFFVVGNLNGAEKGTVPKMHFVSAARGHHPVHQSFTDVSYYLNSVSFNFKHLM